MRLNPDCIRDILLTVEENTGYRESMLYESNQEFARLKKYSEDVVRYHMKQCDLNGYFTKMHIHLGDPPYQPIEILDLSPDGHKFLADIKVDQNWNKTKAIATRVGSYSLNALESIASGVTSAMIDRYFRGV